MKALEQLCHDILERAQAVFGKLDGAAGNFMPLYAKISAADEMQDLLEEFVPRYRKLLTLSSPLPSDEVTQSTERRR